MIDIKREIVFFFFHEYQVIYLSIKANSYISNYFWHLHLCTGPFHSGAETTRGWAALWCHLQCFKNWGSPWFKPRSRRADSSPPLCLQCSTRQDIVGCWASGFHLPLLASLSCTTVYETWKILSCMENWRSSNSSNWCFFYVNQNWNWFDHSDRVNFYPIHLAHWEVRKFRNKIGGMVFPFNCSHHIYISSVTYINMGIDLNSISPYVISDSKAAQMNRIGSSAVKNPFWLRVHPSTSLYWCFLIYV